MAEPGHYPSGRGGVGGAPPPLIFPCPPSPPPTPAPPEASLSTQERLRLARRRRAAQLKRWAQRERGGGGGSNASAAPPPDLLSSSSHSLPRGMASTRSMEPGNIRFVPNVMLLEAAARNDIDEVRRLLELGVSADSTNEDGLTALHQCCIDDSEEMMKLLIDYGADPNATDTEKWTPLHAAATCGHLHLVKFLIDHGANLLAVNADGNMPYDLCEDDTTLSYIENEMAKRGVTQELIDDTRAETERRMLRDLHDVGVASDLLEGRDEHGATPLHIASANGYVSVVEYLLDNHVSTETVDYDLWQPIHAAACWGHLEVVELLAQNGANINAKTKNGETPMDICEDPEIKERLVQLKEQRVRLEQPRVRRSRSASTRTQSIRRTSLREKMNTTKKDVQDEKLYFIQSFDAMPTASANGEQSESASNGTNANSSTSPTNGVVDINDVELTLLPSYVDGEGSARMVNNKVPGRPPRQQRAGEAAGAGSTVASTSGSGQPTFSSSSSMSRLQDQPQQRLSSSSPSSSTDKINIHVSVTINAGGGGPGGAPSTPTSSSSVNNQGSGTTLSDLKKARSMSRSLPNYNSVPASASFSSSPDPPSQASSPPAASATPQQQQHQQQQQPHAVHATANLASRNNNDVKRFSAADTNEVVGPPITRKKTGCCVVM